MRFEKFCEMEIHPMVCIKDGKFGSICGYYRYEGWNKGWQEFVKGGSNRTHTRGNNEQQKWYAPKDPTVASVEMAKLKRMKFENVGIHGQHLHRRVGWKTVGGRQKENDFRSIVVQFIGVCQRKKEGRCCVCFCWKLVTNFKKNWSSLSVDSGEEGEKRIR